MYMYCLQDRGSKELFGGAMTDSEEEGIWGQLQIDFVVILACSVLYIDDFIVDEMGHPINHKKGREQGTDM